MMRSEDEVEAYLRETFEENYELLRLEGAGALSPASKETALEQVLLYWRRLREVAESVTETEVELSLAGQRTPQDHEFTIHGIVDIVREQGRTIMYDIKTHDAEYVRANCELYEQQLNVYAHIWQHLHGQPLDEAAVIATKCPEAVREAFASEDEGRLAHALERWEPLVPIPFDEERVRETIEEFAEVVDAIEDGEYPARPVEDLGERVPGARRLFVTLVCADCDARYSCPSYREYVLGGRGRTERQFREYFGDAGSDVERGAWRTAGLDAAPDTDEVRGDFG